MDAIEEYFKCSACQNRDFRQIYSFAVRFHKVNFSDGLIYDRVTDETYECTKCGLIFTRSQVENKLAEFKRKRRSDD